MHQQLLKSCENKSDGLSKVQSPYDTQDFSLLTGAVRKHTFYLARDTRILRRAQHRAGHEWFQRDRICPDLLNLDLPLHAAAQTDKT